MSQTEEIKTDAACEEEEEDWGEYLKGYYEKPNSFKTWSGLDTKEIYTPKDFDAEKHYKEKVGDAGQYPYTRGIHANMFRGRIWTKREVVGIGSPADTHARLKYLAEQGGTGLNTIADVTYEMGLDADHPWAANEVGLTGVNITNIKDMETLTKDIPLDQVSWSLITAAPSAAATMAQYIAVAQGAGFDITKLRGSVQNDPIHFGYCGFKPASPLDLAIKLGCDIMEYCTLNMPKWYYTTVNMYDLREQGITAIQEVAYGFGIAMCYIDELIKRGLHVDQFGPRFTFYVACHVDIFEEISKLRAARRMWAKFMKEKYGATKPGAMHFRFAVHTSGCSLVPQQPLNNLIRVGYQALAAVLGGVQSLHCCSYDEPICLPTEASHLQALRTQQVLAYETGVTNVADPLGGSYYIEGLTDEIEKKVLEAMAEIDSVGGMHEAIRTEWLDRKLEDEALLRQKEIETGEKLIVGVNIFKSEMEKETPLGVQRVASESGQQQINDVKEQKRLRNWDNLMVAMQRLKDDAVAGKNTLPAMIEATKANATTGEMIGTVREVMGHHYDPMESIESPFTFK